MHVRAMVVRERVKGGVAVRAPGPGLVGHGATQVEAEESLSAALGAWCIGLSRAGVLSKATRKVGVEVTAEGEGPVRVELIVAAEVAP
jgi:hypothetical protein